jgi:hypothetical protein
LDAGQLDPNNGEQVGGDQEVLAEHHRRIREADKGTEDGGDQGELAGGDQGAQGQIATGPGSILSPGNSLPPRVPPALTGPEAIQLRLRQKKEEVGRLRVLRDQIEQGELDVRYRADQDREEAHQQAKKLAAQNERARQKAENKRVKMREAEEKKAEKVTKQGPEEGGEASGWVLVAMRDDRGRMVYDQSGRVKYHPKNGPQDGQIKNKKKPPPVRSNSPSPPTMQMATTSQATRASTRTKTTPRHLQDYVHGAELDLDSLGLLPVQHYDQSDLSNLLNESSDYIQARIQMQEEELRARNAREQAMIQKRLAKGPRNASPRED